ncbi:hypothetical protein [Winogradskyella sp. 3972H.M.0a.05]|uniref:hypothetical protein n=1 Tax=Winogradskyella sp. 3972H.M.0a.05 TaxID=2950277 RepID=UPI003398BC37
MILDTTYRNDEHKQLINDLVGKPFSLFQSLRLGGIGSKRMIIDEVSPNLSSYLNAISDINYGSIELRPHGILMHFTKGLTRYTWAIPYYHLVIYKINGISFHSQGKFIHFRDSKTFKENKNFLKKLTKLKLESNMDHSLEFR